MLRVYVSGNFLNRRKIKTFNAIKILKSGKIDIRKASVKITK